MNLIKTLFKIIIQITLCYLFLLFVLCINYLITDEFIIPNYTSGILIWIAIWCIIFIIKNKKLDEDEDDEDYDLSEMSYNDIKELMN